MKIGHVAMIMSAQLAGQASFCQTPGGSPDERAAALEQQMTLAELDSLVHGQLAIAFGGFKPPDNAIPGAGYVPGIPRLGIPALTESDASLGVAYVMGLRKDGATALPSGSALAASWDPDLLHEGGLMIGHEARVKGFNVLLAGGVNLVRDPRNGRTFEYLGEDPWLAGTLDAASIAGIQSNHVISTAKHFAFNDQETGRQFYDVKISEGAARESDLLAFEVAIERGRPGAVMCSYNRVNGAWGCANGPLLNGVLKGNWGYKGFVMSDWGAVHATDYALQGLDQQSGEQVDKQIWFGAPLLAAAQTDAGYSKRLHDMAHRILRTMFDIGVDSNVGGGGPVDAMADASIAERAALEGIVLLRNRAHALPLGGAGLSRIAVIGGYANTGVLSGGGSSQVQGEGGPAYTRLPGGDSPQASMMSEQYQRSVPVKAIRAEAPTAEVIYRDGRHLTDAVLAARQADVAIVFATQHMTEGLDLPDLALPDGQDALIEAVSAANPHTIVVLETGGPVRMPWLQQTEAVLEAWYPGARGAEAIAAVLFGAANPSGRLPITFPASESQLPRPMLPGADSVEPNFLGFGKAGQTLSVDYDIEGSDVGYRWYARQALVPLFPFGFGLSYTTFEISHPKLSVTRQGVAAEVSVTNTGNRAGADVIQLYLTGVAGTSLLRLAAYQRVALGPGESRSIVLPVDNRLLSQWESGGWNRHAGLYRFAVGSSATDFGDSAEVNLPELKRPD